MASQSALITRVRRRVHDAEFDEALDLPHYNNEVYIDCLTRGLMRVNLVLQTDYTISAVPTKVEYLVELRTTIEMCHIRGAEGATGDVTDAPDLAIQTITLPAGFTQSNSQMSYEGARFWRNLASTLEREFEDIIGDVKNALDPTDGEVQVGYMQRISNRTRKAISYYYDRPLTAPDIAVSVSGSTVTVSWEPILTEFLESYVIERSTDSFGTITEVYTTFDNQIGSYAHTNVPVGTYKYRLRVVNSNGISSYSPDSNVEIV